MCLAIVVALVTRWGFNAYSNVWLAKWETVKTSSNTTDDTFYKLGVYGALGAAQTFLVASISISIAYAGFTASQFYHDVLLKMILYAPLSFFNATPTGVILNRIGADVTKIDDEVPEAVRSVVEISISMKLSP